MILTGRAIRSSSPSVSCSITQGASACHEQTYEFKTFWAVGPASRADLLIPKTTAASMGA